MITYVTGDATSPLKYPSLICHVCNDIGAWGSGFVLALRKKFPQSEVAYRNWFKSSDVIERPILGNVQFVVVNADIAVANMIAQHGIGIKNGNIPLRYDALSVCLQKVNSFAVQNKAVVHMPRIGCGLAGGSWAQVKKSIRDNLLVDTYVYTLPSDKNNYDS